MKTLFKLLPAILLMVLVVTGMDILMAAFFAFFCAVALCMYFEKMPSAEVIGVGIENAKDGLPVAFIMMMAYGMAEIYMATGVGAAAISMFINLGVTARSLALIAFLATCVLSVATGTSWGTFAACIPIFIWLGNVVGGNPGLVMAACMGGAAFGDNVGLISDTTILSSGLADVKVADRVRSQLPWSLLCVAVSALLFWLLSVSMGLPGSSGDPGAVLAGLSADTIAVLEAERPTVLLLLAQVQEGVPYYLLIPVMVVIVMAVRRLDTVICLLAGIVLAVGFGFAAGTVTSLPQIIGMLQNGFADAGSWAIILTFWAMAFCGIMRRMDAFAPLVDFFVGASCKVRHLSTCNGLLCLIMNLTLADEIAQMVTAGPIIKDIINENVEGSEEDKYTLRLRSALFSGAVGVHSATLIPWHTGVAYYVGLTLAVYPFYEYHFTDLYYNCMSLLTIISIYILTFTGWDRFIPWFGQPSEPAVSLKKESGNAERYLENEYQAVGYEQQEMEE